MECFQSLAHPPRMRSMVDWVDKPMDEDDFVNEASAGGTPETKEPQVLRVRVLVEIVGAMCLDSKRRHTVDPYCSVIMYDPKLQKVREVHRTDTIRNDGNPIWTVRTKSLCMVEVPEVSGSGDLRNSSIEKADATLKEKNVEGDITQNVVFDILHGSTRLGRVCVAYPEVIRHCSKSGPADRVEFRVEGSHAVLALRFRFADELDAVFFYKLTQRDLSVRELTKATVTSPEKSTSTFNLFSGPGVDRKVAADINFYSVKTKSIFQRGFKKEIDGQEIFRVVPYPDPDQPEATEWLSATDVEHTAYQPSTQWVAAGGGSLGTLFVEVVGCDNLPQMDFDLSKTDAFVALAFEDNFLRTDVIWDHFSPRWMPWTTRAFRFAVRHPASLLCVSVLDFDEGPLDQYDPIGRVVVRPSSFRPGMTYTLHYPLQNDPIMQPLSDSSLGTDLTELPTKKTKATRGTIILRLRMEWENEGAAMKQYFTPPPRFIINVDNEKSFKTLRYTTEGPAYMNEVSIRSVKLLANEIMEYRGNVFYALDVILGTLLWRGRWQLAKDRSFWFPLHSAALLTAAAIVVERPNLTIPVLLYAVAWVLLSLNYIAYSHPNPWLRVPSSREMMCLMLLGRRSIFPHEDRRPKEIAPNQKFVEGAQREKLYALKAARITALIEAATRFALKVSSIYSKAGNAAIKITTEQHSWHFLASQLAPVHSLACTVCNLLRFCRNFLSWKSNYTAVVTTNCILLATAWLIFPVSRITRWLLRAIVWTLLGPWMGKFLDYKYFRPWYATDEELIERIQNGTADVEHDLPDFDSVLESDTFGKIVHAGRLQAEELYKLRDMRTLLFGSFSDAVPFSDNSRYPSVPLPQSSAVRTDWIVPPVDSIRGYFVPGQLLTGNMIHSRTLSAVHLYEGDESQSAETSNGEGKKTI